MDKINTISWFQPERYFIGTSFNPLILLDEEFNMCRREIKGLKTPLMTFQRTSVQTLSDIEKKKKMSINYEGTAMISYTTAGVFSDPVGSGKTISILALILLNKTIKPIPEIINVSKPYSKYTYRSACIRRKFKKIIKTTIIFVASSVLNQWEEAITSFTSLKYFKVSNVRDLRALFKHIENGTISKYSIILIKNGKITREVKLPFGLPLEKKNQKKTVHIYNAICNIRNICWMRIVIDDFDTIGLPSNAGIINGAFTWYISSTKKNTRGHVPKNLSDKIEDRLLYYDYGCKGIMNNIMLFRIYNVRCKLSYISKYNNLTNPIYYEYVLHNADDVYINIIKNMNNTDESAIMAEMLNSGSIKTAAELVGTNANSVADIFEKILGSRYNLYKKSVDMLEFMDTIYVDSLPKAPEGEKYGKQMLLDHIMPEYKYPNLKSMIKDATEEFEEKKKISSREIERVKDNISDGECPICLNNFKDADGNIIDTVIMKCCSMIICNSCVVQANGFSSHSRKGRCSKCRAVVTIRSMIYVSLDLERLISDKSNDSDSDSDSDDESDESDSDDSDDSDSSDDDSDIEREIKKLTKINKLGAMVKLIKGEFLPQKKKRELSIQQLQLGKDMYIAPPKGLKKVLIFSSYKESVDAICNTLEEEKIAAWRLGGTSKNMTSLAKKFNASKKSCALVINATRYCSGLNLQTCTDLIFMHRIVDPSTETQVAGRAVRLGRTYSVNIHYMLYKNET